MDRRQFLQLSLAAGATSLLDTQLGFPWSMAHAQTAGKKKLLVVFLRGGADVLSLFPTEPAAMRAFRSENCIVTSANSFKPRTLPFRLHEGLSDLEDLIAANQAAFITHTASLNTTRSHFHQMDLIESGSDNALTPTGYLARAAHVLDTQSNHGGRPIAIGETVPYSLRGIDPILVNNSADIQGDIKALLRSRTIAESSLSRQQRLELLKRAADCSEGTFCERVDKTQQKYGLLEDAMHGKELPSDAIPTFEKHMKLAAEVMASDYSPRIVTVNFGGWDSHFNANPNEGKLADNIRALGKNLKAFRNRFSASDWNDVVVVVMSEFGRTVKSNPSFGTDHGAGSMMMVLGGRVNSQHSRSSLGWDLTNFEDTRASSVSAADAGSSSALLRKVDLRIVMAEILHRHLGINPNIDVTNFDTKVSKIFDSDFRLTAQQYLNVIKV